MKKQVMTTVLIVLAMNKALSLASAGKAGVTAKKVADFLRS